LLDASSKNGKQPNQDDAMSQLIQSTKQHLTPQAIDELLSIGPSWKKVKTHCDNIAKDDICSWPSTVQRMTKEYNQSTAAAAAATTIDEQTLTNPITKQKQMTTRRNNLNHRRPHFHHCFESKMKSVTRSTSVHPLVKWEMEDLMFSLIHQLRYHRHNPTLRQLFLK